MNYEYKSLCLVAPDDQLNKSAEWELQQWFNKGWEYVDTIRQTGSNTRVGGIMVILRKEKQDVSI